MNPTTHYQKPISLEQLFGLADPPPAKLLLRREQESGTIEVMSEAITIVLSRDVRANVHSSAEIALRIAHEHPKRHVLYLNTYAGTALMKQVFRDAMTGCGITEPATSGTAPSGPATSDAAVPETDATSLLPNLRVINIPTGKWTPGLLQALLAEQSKRSEQIVGEQTADEETAGNEETAEAANDHEGYVLILNSYEYAPPGTSAKWRIARELVTVQQEYQITMLLFSHEMRLDLEAGLPGRGSLGLVAGRAAAVTRIADPFEKLIRSRKHINKPDKGIIHEAQTSAFINDPSPYLWRGTGAVDQKTAPFNHLTGQLEDYSELMRRPWDLFGDLEMRSGADLAKRARTPLLRRFFAARPDEMFLKEYAPTEQQLQEKADMYRTLTQ